MICLEALIKSKFAVGAVTAEKSLWWWWWGGGGVGWTRPVLGFSLSQAEQYYKNISKISSKALKKNPAA